MSDLLNVIRLNGFSHVYWLGGEIRPGSVRDSLWRASYATELLARQKSIGPGKNVLVVGAGISGMAASAHAASAGANVTLCERRPDVYSPFENCAIRRICPTTFDFPREHWRDARYPYPTMPKDYPALFEWDADFAFGVFGQISDQFSVLMQNVPGTFERAFSTTILNMAEDAAQNIVKVTLSTLGDRDYHAVLLATGIGALRRRLRPESLFEGYAYFDNDPLFAGELKSNGRKRVLLIGGGDGSLVDFVRLVTGQQDIHPTLSELGLPTSAITELQQIAADMWSELSQGPSDIHLTYDRLQWRMIDYIDRLWANKTVRKKVRRLMKLAPGQRPYVQVAVNCLHFGFAYLANRVLAHLIACQLATDLAKENGGLYPFRIGVEVTDIASIKPAGDLPITHTCSGIEGCRADCRRFPHQVSFQQRFCRSSLPDYVAQRPNNPAFSHQTFTLNTTEQPVFDRILVRTGTELSGGDLAVPAEIARAFENRGGIWHVPAFYTG